MSRIFLSHSSANSAEAVAIRDWLVSQGFDDLFLDLDPERGLKAGHRWQEALKHAAERCELVIFLISPEWVGSKWCLAEFLLAKNLNKRIFGVIVVETPFADIPDEMTSEWQLVDLTVGERCHKAAVGAPPDRKSIQIAFSKEGLERLRLGLIESGIDARYFGWPPDNDPNRAPYRGLQPLEAEDAGIFFGREGPTVLALDLLRGLRNIPPPRLLVILGASGAGKSSFLRAGLVPRLARESQHFITLPIIRPERATLTGAAGLIHSLEKASRESGLGYTRAEIRKTVEGGASSMGMLLQEIVAARSGDDRKPPMLILSLDQAEELFLPDGAEEADDFLSLIGQLVTRDDPALTAVFTMRSDSYERLQTAECLGGLRQHTLSLSPMPKGAYAEVIKGPARRLEGTRRPLKIEETLVDALLQDVERGGAKDALPLLAFSLERLFIEHGGDGDLKLSEYEGLGGVKGSIEAAIDRALQLADTDPRIPRDREARVALLRRGLIPWLAGIDPENGNPRRRIARLSEIPVESRPLIDLLVNQRLLATDVSQKTGEAVIEPIHEALLRQWSLLQGWLAEDAGLLGVLEGIKRATRDWAANAKSAFWLSHATGRLSSAETLLARPDLAASLEPTDREYLTACRTHENLSRRRKRRASALAIGLTAAIVMGVGLSYFGMLDPAYLEGRVNWVQNTIREISLEPGQVVTECSTGCPEMAVIPPGRFKMGVPPGADYEGNAENEHPQHEVELSKQFLVSRYELTFADWDACVAEGGCSYSPKDEGWGRGNRPVINISWQDVKQYLTWLSAKTGKPYRLLSEAEWEYSARAGSEKAFSWGGDYGYDIPEGVANCQSCGSQWDYKQTAPAGSFEPNKFGLYDMHGNVMEWVADCYHPTYSGAPTNGSAWDADCSDKPRVARGGSWLNYPIDIRSGKRTKYFSERRTNFLGFRIGRSI